MDDERFEGLTKRQTEVLSLCAINEDGGHPRKVLESLAKKGYLEAYEEAHRDRLGAFTITRYRVPLDVHIRWCFWCSENAPEGED